MVGACCIPRWSSSSRPWPPSAPTMAVSAGLRPFRSGLTTCRLSCRRTGSQRVERGAGHGIAVYLCTGHDRYRSRQCAPRGAIFWHSGGGGAVGAPVRHLWLSPVATPRCCARQASRVAGGKTHRAPGLDWPACRCPAIAHLQDGQYVVLARVDGEQVVVQDPREARPLSLPRPLFEATWNGTLILLTKRLRLRGRSATVWFRLVRPGAFSSTGGSSARCSWRHFFCKSLPY